MWQELIITEQSGGRLPLQAWRATTRREAQRGLLDETEWAPNQALLLSGAPLIHTLGMRLPLDLVWLRAGRIVKIARGVQPGRMGFAWAWHALELGAGGVELLGIELGQKLQWADLAG